MYKQIYIQADILIYVYFLLFYYTMRVYDLNRYNYQGKSNIWMRLDINGYDEIKTHILYYKVGSKCFLSGITNTYE